ncbi:MAG: hypothetical protein HYR55_13125 [Acidobacteria bacterium]|nr:hypothetical protein [Acidobacteriota bacterium]
MKATIDRVPILVTLIMLVALPLALLGYHRIYLPYKFRGARIITLTALASDGVWTREPVMGINYWRKHFSATPNIHIQQGESVVLRLASADVLHSFAIPALNIGPIEVPAGEVREVKFTGERPGPLVFLCWQVCSPVHEKLRGQIVVLGPGGQPGPEDPKLEPDLDGRSPQ